MKQLIVIVAIVLISLNGFSQQISKPDSVTFNKENYHHALRMSKLSLAKAVIAVESGVPLVVVGCVDMIAGYTQGKHGARNRDGVSPILKGTTNDVLIRTGAIIAGIGAVMELASIPVTIHYFKKSHTYWKEAKQIKLHLNSSSYTVPLTSYSSSTELQLGIGLSISL